MLTSSPLDRQLGEALPAQDQGSQALTTEWIIVVFRFGGLFVFSLIGLLLPPAHKVDLYTLYLFVLAGFVYALYSVYILYNGDFMRQYPHYLSFFVSTDILLLLALGYFSNLFQSQLLFFFLFLIIIVSLRASLKTSLIIGPILVVAYYITTLFVSESGYLPLGRLSLDAAGLLAMSAACGWFAQGRNRAWLAVADISRHLQSARRELDETQRQLFTYKHLQEMQREFCAVMSHELRTPLTGIIGYSDLMLLGDTGPLNNQQRDIVFDMTRKGVELLSLIDNILDINKINSGRWALHLESCDPRSLVTEASNIISPEARKKDIEISHDSAVVEPPPMIMVDREKIIRVLLNLIGNAVKFTPAGGRVSISEAVCRDPNLEAHFPHVVASSQAVCFTVSDNGLGIDPEDEPHIFEMFYRGRPRNNAALPAGAGLGLAVARELVDLHWGKIRYLKNQSGGCDFIFTLPINPLRLRRRIHLVQSRFMLQDLLEGLLLQFGSEIKRKKLAVARRGFPASGGTLEIEADRQLLQCVFFNILNNKIHYSMPNSELEIALSMDLQPGWISLRFANRGETMENQVLDQLNRGLAPGEGADDLRHLNVNLNLSRDIIESHGGTFEVMNVADKGAAVILALPLSSPNQGDRS